MSETITKKILGSLPAGVRDDMDAMGITQLKEQVVQSTAILRANARDMKEDEDLQNAKERVKVAMEGYKEIKAAKGAIIAYAIHLLEEKGVSYELVAQDGAEE